MRFRLPDLRPWRTRIALFIALAIAGAVVFTPTIRGLAARPDTGSISELSVENFANGVATAGDVLASDGLTPSQHGLVLGAAQRGSLTYRMHPAEAAQAFVAWINLPAGGTNRIAVSADGGHSFVTVGENVRWSATSVPLPITARGSTSLVFRFDAFNPNAHDVLFVDKLVLSASASNTVVLPQPVEVSGLILWGGLLCALVTRRPLTTLMTTLVLAIAADLRYKLVPGLAGSALDPDAQMYLQYAKSFVPFSSTGFYSAAFQEREPLFVFVSWTFGKLFGFNDLTMRLQSVLLSTVAVWAFLRLGRALFGPTTGQVIGLVLAVNGPLVDESIRGLRLELELILVALFVGCAFVWRWKSVWLHSVTSGVAGALLALTRTTYMPAVGLLSAVALARDSTTRSPARWLIAVGLAGGIVVGAMIPHRMAMLRVRGDAFWDTTVYARWNANVEFAGTPGFPSRDAVEAAPYQGPRITYADYMYGLHTPGEVIVGTLRGYGKMIYWMIVNPHGCSNFAPLQTTFNRVFQCCGLVGLGLALLRRRWQWLPLAFILTTFAAAFLYDRSLVERYRHTYQAFPLFLMAATLCVFRVLRLTPAIETASEPVDKPLL